MNLSKGEAKGFFARPDPRCPGILIYGTDAMRVSLKRTELVANVVGPQGEEEMRLERIDGGDLRKQPSLLSDAVKAVGFFPGQRCVVVTDANEFTLKAADAALSDWAEGDAMVVMTAGALKKTSKLLKLFQGHKAARALAIYDDPPTKAEVEEMLQEAGLTRVSPEAMDGLLSLSRTLDPGDFRQLIEKLSLYQIGDNAPLGTQALEHLSPATLDAPLDDILHAVAEGRSGEIGPLIQRLDGQGVAPVTLAIFAGRHFRTLHSAASDPGGAGAGIARARPPVFGPRRERMLRQCQAWGMHRLEAAMRLITEADLTLRSAGQTAPQMAVMERVFIRLAMMAAARK
ncbi:DNA polymerase III subunit delta [Alphaproteobacteria bacterium KMM 3653]|uniref:DNA-directed DNA polymerase n=1 Tax=Harenicola maris TaxID=2841044 RepID=A0AAP2CSQ4_9RHOB|nr:DNA polymerase III subunit delta [Harenicola maris]